MVSFVDILIRPGTASVLIDIELIENEWITSDLVIRKEIGVLAGIINGLEAIKQRIVFELIIILSFDLFFICGYSNLQNHWFPRIKIGILLMEFSSVLYNKKIEGAAIDNKIMHGRDVQKVSTILFSAKFICKLFFCWINIIVSDRHKSIHIIIMRKLLKFVMCKVDIE